jgi:alpha-tubulin suppressor-like RCC1 family protein
MGAALTAVDLGTGRKVLTVVAGVSPCALLDDGSVKCWGSNAYGTLGLGDMKNRGDEPGEMGDALPPVNLGSRRAISISVGSGHACAVLDDGSAKCWGHNHLGQLGLGDTEDRGDEPGEMGDALPAVNLGNGARLTAIAAGYAHTCALLQNGSVKCWGFGGDGSLGLGDTEGRGDEPGEMGGALPAVNLGSGRRATAIAAGGSDSCALLDDGSIKCWGYNPLGRLGLGDSEWRGDEPGEMGDDLPTVSLGTGRQAVRISARNGLVAAVLDDGALKSWGYNDLGQLGLGDIETRGDELGDMGDALPAVNLGSGRSASSVAASGNHSCALLDDGTLKCWGGNAYGSLGLGDTENRGDQPGEMGDALPAVELGF